MFQLDFHIVKFQSHFPFLSVNLFQILSSFFYGIFDRITGGNTYLESSQSISELNLKMLFLLLLLLLFPPPDIPQTKRPEEEKCQEILIKQIVDSQAEKQRF